MADLSYSRNSKFFMLEKETIFGRSFDASNQNDVVSVRYSFS